MSTLPTHAVRSRRFYYGPSDEVGIAFVGTREECLQFIEDDDEEIYHTSHNESGRWTLRVVTTNSLKPYAMAQAITRWHHQDSYE